MCICLIRTQACEQYANRSLKATTSADSDRSSTRQINNKKPSRGRCSWNR